MRDMKSFILGLLCAAALFLMLSVAERATEPPARYQITATNCLYIVDMQTGKVKKVTQYNTAYEAQP